MKNNYSKHLLSALALCGYIVLLIGSGTQKEATTGPLTCQYSMDEYDDFTKSRNVGTKGYLIYEAKVDLTVATGIIANYAGKSTVLRLYVSAGHRDGKKFLFIQKFVEDVQFYLRIYIPYEKEVRFLLLNDEVIDIVPDCCDDETMKKGEFGSSWFTQTIRFECDSVAWSKLKNNSIKKIRIPYIGNETIYQKDYLIPDQDKDKISFVLKCIDNLVLNPK